MPFSPRSSLGARTDADALRGGALGRSGSTRAVKLNGEVKVETAAEAAS